MMYFFQIFVLVISCSFLISSHTALDNWNVEDSNTHLLFIDRAFCLNTHEDQTVMQILPQTLSFQEKYEFSRHVNCLRNSPTIRMTNTTNFVAMCQDIYSNPIQMIDHLVIFAIDPVDIQLNILTVFWKSQIRISVILKEYALENTFGLNTGVLSAYERFVGSKRNSNLTVITIEDDGQYTLYRIIADDCDRIQIALNQENGDKSTEVKLMNITKGLSSDCTLHVLMIQSAPYAYPMENGRYRGIEYYLLQTIAEKIQMNVIIDFMERTNRNHFFDREYFKIHIFIGYC